MKSVFVVNEYVEDDVVPIGQTEKGVVRGIFTTRELAQKYIDAGNPSQPLEYRIEEFSINPWQNEIEKGLKPYFIRMKRSGEVVERYWTDIELGYPDENDSNCNIGIDVFSHLFYHSFAESDEHASEMCEAIRLKVLANYKWPDRNPLLDI
jgi:hypothetical protein